MNPIFDRVSVRRWSHDAVSKDDIDQILRAAMQAPSACNSQPWEFVVITKESVKEELSALSPYAHFARLAPVIIALLMRKDNECPQYNDIDMGICTENILLEAQMLGLGAVCLGISPIQERMEAMDKILDVPNTLESFALIALGHPVKEQPPIDRYDPDRIRWIED